MYEDNDLLKVLINYNFNDLYRGEKSVSLFLKEHFNQYIKDIKFGLVGQNELLEQSLIDEITNDFDKVINIRSSIVEIIRTFENGHIEQAYDKAYDLFNNSIDLLLTKEFDDRYLCPFSRVRSGELQSNDKKELFHIPQNKSELIGAYRYSVAGFPCMYLANDLVLSWYECNMPKKFSFCYMKIAKDKKLKLLNFTERPMDFLYGNIAYLFNAMKDNQEDLICFIKGQIKKYIITYPIVASCSLIVKDRNKSYVAEYIIPQLLMQWIRESDNYDGVIYKSSLNSNLKDGMGAFNLALPVKEFRENGLCKNLTRKLMVSDVKSIDTVKYFEEQKEELLQQILQLKNDIWIFLIIQNARENI